MRRSNNARWIGGVIVIIGVITLFIGMAMPATTTQTSETCINDPTSIGQDCINSSVTMPNPLKGYVSVIGVLALIGGIGILLISNTGGQNKGSAKSDETTKGDFAKKLQNRKEDQNKNKDNSQ